MIRPAAFLLLFHATFALAAEPLPRIAISSDGKGFAEEGTGKKFIPWGVNYDHDKTGRLIEDYWDKEWAKVEADFREIRELGANVARIHIQVSKFLRSPTEANSESLDRLAKLLELAERERVYVDLTGLGCYHKADVPPWYDALNDDARWDAQAVFWKAVAARCAKSPAIFCYDLMNEPVVSGTQRKPGDWLAGAFAGKHFVQFINLEPAPGGDRPEVARKWIDSLVKAVREVDSKHLITVGMVDWSLDRKGLTSGFVPSKVARNLDFLCTHIYPERGKVNEALETLAGFAAVGKPVVIEETFPLKCSKEELIEFIDRSRASNQAAGWISFYWGETAESMKGSKEISDAIVRDWLETFQKHGKIVAKP